MIINAGGRLLVYNEFLQISTDIYSYSTPSKTRTLYTSQRPIQRCCYKAFKLRTVGT